MRNLKTFQMSTLGAFTLLLCLAQPIHATEGAYQEFDNGRMYSSNLGTFAVIGRLNELHLEAGGTAVVGFPIGDQYLTENRGLCQQFELKTICEQKEATPVDPRSPSEKAIDARASQLGSTGASTLTLVCGFPAKVYEKLFGNNDGLIVYANSKAIYSYGGALDTFLSYSDDFFFPIIGDTAHEYFYDIWSNIHYGYVGRAAGFDSNTLQTGAGLGGIAGANDAADVLSVSIGTSLWETYGFDLPPSAISQAILSNTSNYLKLRLENREILAIIDTTNGR